MAMEKKSTPRISLDMQLKKLEIQEKEKELLNMDRRLNNVSRGIVIDQINSLARLLETRVAKESPIPGNSSEWGNAFDDEDMEKIRAKIMRLINTF